MILTAQGVPPIAITLTVAPPFPWVRVEGRLTGLDQLKIRPDRILIATPSVAATLVSGIAPDGRFEFHSALPGVYDVVLSPVPDTLRRTLTVESGSVNYIEIPAVPR